MVAMLEHTSKGEEHYDNYNGMLRWGVPGYSTVLHSTINRRKGSGSFRYGGNPNTASGYSRYQRSFRLGLSSYTHGYSGRSRWFHRTTVSPGGSRHKHLAVESDHDTRAFRHYPGQQYSQRKSEWGKCIGGNISGRIATLKWRGDLLWKPGK